MNNWRSGLTGSWTTDWVSSNTLTEIPQYFQFDDNTVMQFDDSTSIEVG